MSKIYYQEDCNLSMLEGKTIAIIGYGSQGQRLRHRALKCLQQQRLQRRLISL